MPRERDEPAWSGGPTVGVGVRRAGDDPRAAQIADLVELGYAQQSPPMPQAFTAENVPHVFEDFVVQGTLTEAGLVPQPAPGPRRSELPLHEDIVDFPAAPSRSRPRSDSRR